MNLFDRKPCKFSLKDTIELKSGFDMYNIYSRCRVWAIDSGAIKIAPWQAVDPVDVATQSIWLVVSDAEKRYHKVGVAR